mmetsp:Transcript_33652/g.67311  ORF Transcript_33652/g.67311 Transcript_33652/m.67311 type:complete len:215 (-) Transcript_33652:265-909(-)
MLRCCVRLSCGCSALSHFHDALGLLPGGSVSEDNLQQDCSAEPRGPSRSHLHRRRAKPSDPKGVPTPHLQLHQSGAGENAPTRGTETNLDGFLDEKVRLGSFPAVRQSEPSGRWDPYEVGRQPASSRVEPQPAVERESEGIRACSGGVVYGNQGRARHSRHQEFVGHRKSWCQRLAADGGRGGKSVSSFILRRLLDFVKPQEAPSCYRTLQAVQ